jgi:hypothetical protein
VVATLTERMVGAWLQRSVAVCCWAAFTEDYALAGGYVQAGRYRRGLLLLLLHVDQVVLRLSLPVPAFPGLRGHSLSLET